MASFPEAFIGPLRVGASPAMADILINEPLIFAAHYATIGDTLVFPENITALLEAVRSRYSKHDSVLELLDKLRHQISIPLTADLAKRLAEGLDLHTEIRPRFADYQSWCQTALENFSVLSNSLRCAGDDSPSSRVATLSQLMEFSTAESGLLKFALAHTLVPSLRLLTRLVVADRWRRQSYWQATLNVNSSDLTAALSLRGKLAGAGLLTSDDGIPSVSEFWIEHLIRTDTPLEEGIVQTLARKDTPGGTSRLPAEDQTIVVSLLQKPAVGINVLVYGKHGVDKHNLTYRLIHEAGCVPYTLANDIPDRDHPAALMVAQRLLTRKTDPVLVVEKSSTVLTRVYPEVFVMFGLTEDSEDVKPMDERLLSENPVPTVWLTHDAQRFHRDTLARFLFHAEALRGTRADRQSLIETMIVSLPVADKHKQDLIKLEGLSEQQIASARTVAELTAPRSRKTYARHLLVTATRSQKALARREKDQARIPVTTYSLDYINTSGRFGPTQILKALQVQAKGSLCLYGIPGTGKTQFAEHLAHQLAKPILIKPASELLNKYVGESEKHIAEAFDQAEEEGAILLLDEADSFLRDRTRSTHNWEVTSVNELLQRMERFEDIFICTTNLYSQIDSAALRRFTFKLEFLPLNAHQRWEMFLNETNLRGKVLTEKRIGIYEDRLVLMKDLTAGDFATVKRQCLLLGEELSAEEWLDQLELEVKAKQRSAVAPAAEGVML